MLDGTTSKITAPVVVGLGGHLAGIALFQYWQASHPYFVPVTSGLIMAGSVVALLVGTAAWALANYHLAEGRGQDTRLAYLAPTGLFGFLGIFLTKDRHTPKKHYLKHAAHNKPKKAW